MPNHGGKRQGAGRKPSGRTKRVGPFMLSPEAAEWLNTQVNKSEAVDKLILEKIQSQQKTQPRKTALSIHQVGFILTWGSRPDSNDQI